MKLYDVIRKEDIERGTPLKEIPLQQPLKGNHDSHLPHRRFILKKIIVVGLAALFLALLYIVGMKVAHAKVVVTERRIPFTLDGEEFELVPEGDGSVGRLSFQTMAVPTEVSRQVYGSQVEPYTSMASGKVVFFNEYSSAAQTVKAKTTLTSSTGKTYQTTQTVTVPGYSVQNKVKTAGTSAATPIVATAAGPAYNTDGASFTVSGWSGSRAKQFYAQSAGSIGGGEDGVAHSVAPSDQGDVVATLQAQLVERLKRETRAQVPDTLIAYPDMQVTTIDSNSLQLKGDSVKFPASIKGTMVTYLIGRDLLQSAIANRVLQDHTYPEVSIPALSDLTVTPISALPTDPKDVPAIIKVKISGEGTIITKAPVDKIKESLVGTPKRNFAAILESIPEVDTAEYHFYPFWAPFFPNAMARISVETK